MPLYRAAECIATRPANFPDRATLDARKCSKSTLGRRRSRAQKILVSSGILAATSDELNFLL